MSWGLGLLIAFVIALLIKIIKDLRRLYEAGAYDGPPAATNDGIAAMQAMLAKLQQLQKEDRAPTQSESTVLKQLYDEAQAGNVSALSLGPMREAIEQLCD